MLTHGDNAYTHGHIIVYPSIYVFYQILIYNYIYIYIYLYIIIIVTLLLYYALCEHAQDGWQLGIINSATEHGIVAHIYSWLCHS